MKTLFIALIILTASSCWFLDNSEPCLVCEFNTDDGVDFYERVCSDDVEEREDMRAEAQAKADSLGVMLMCRE